MNKLRTFLNNRAIDVAYAIEDATVSFLYLTSENPYYNQQRQAFADWNRQQWDTADRIISFARKYI